MASDVQAILSRASSADLRMVRFLYCDHTNIIRGKAAHASALEDFLSSGIGLTVAMQGFCLTEHLAPTTHLGPVGEIRLVPALETFSVLPYRPRCVVDRKSTRLNSSHRTISYAVFCLKKKIDQLYVRLVFASV